MSADIKETGCGANKVHRKYKVDQIDDTYDRIFDRGRRRWHLQTSRLSIDSGRPIALSVDQLSINNVYFTPKYSRLSWRWKLLENSAVNAQYLLPIKL